MVAVSDMVAVGDMVDMVAALATWLLSSVYAVSVTW